MLAAVLGVLLFLVAGIAVVDRGAVERNAAGRDAVDSGVAGPQGRSGRAVVGPAADRRETAVAIAALQDRLRRLPGDWSAWADLGGAYLRQAQATADPAYYARAEGAFERSLTESPEGNAAALAGQGALAAARHDFARALKLADRALAVNAFDSGALGVKVDALVELGRYDAAFATLQRMVDLKPGVPSYTRVSYAAELRGDVEGARGALERALAASATPADAAFALRYLGELAFSQGDLDTAAARFAEGTRRDPSYVPLLAGTARVAAARGDLDAALSGFATVVERLPEPGYVMEYADLLESAGRTQEATRQHEVVAATAALFRAQGGDVDLELALHDADHGRGPEALAAARAAYDKRRSVHVEDAYAWALHAAGRSAEALPHADAAARLGTRSALFAYHRGMIEKALGKDVAARASLRRALEINPHFSPLQAPRARAALDELGRS